MLHSLHTRRVLLAGLATRSLTDVAWRTGLPVHTTKPVHTTRHILPVPATRSLPDCSQCAGLPIPTLRAHLPGAATCSLTDCSQHTSVPAHTRRNLLLALARIQTVWIAHNTGVPAHTRRILLLERDASAPHFLSWAVVLPHPLQHLQLPAPSGASTLLNMCARGACRLPPWLGPADGNQGVLLALLGFPIGLGGGAAPDRRATHGGDGRRPLRPDGAVAGTVASCNRGNGTGRGPKGCHLAVFFCLFSCAQMRREGCAGNQGRCRCRW